MPDMLVKLYTLPPVEPLLSRLNAEGVTVRRALAPEKHRVIEWVREHFGTGWASECEVAFARQPIACFIAVAEENVVGFACHDATCKNFFGPTGVSEAQRGRGIGQALLLACLHDMAAQGYAYAIVGGVGPAGFYARVAGAVVIEGSEAGIYQGMLRHL
jgi:ribosomal protein S18 acetylase RimI-like enzyme